LHSGIGSGHRISSPGGGAEFGATVLDECLASPKEISMPTEKSSGFEELTKLATDFVTAQKGLWDHAAWSEFLSNVRTKGFDVSTEMQSSLGELLEAMKRFYSAAASTESVEKAMRSVVNDSVAFVKKQKGVWGHTEWEEFVKTVRQNTIALSEGTTAYLGSVLESMKVFYGLSPIAVAQKRLRAARHKPSPAPQPAASEVKKEEAEPVTAKPPAQAAPAQAAPAAAKPLPKRVEKRDDLTAIGGIGPALERKLNAAGISSYAQLAALSNDDIDHLEKNIIKFSGRIRRDDWVGQAKALSRSR
jgi:predicted flap endonuclease-1-like 5' DNA nuclease